MAPDIVLAQWELQTFKDFPPRERTGRFTIDHSMEKLLDAQRFSN
jgi:hypothetical protein